MNILQKIRQKVRGNIVLKKFIAYYLVPTGLFDSWFLNMKPNEKWKKRIKLVKSSPDNQKIPRHPDAGRIIRGKQIMHNGLKIMLGSYYGPEVSHMLLENRGVHEPQEEYVFSKVLEDLRKKSKSQYSMIELGSFWAFYSMWFKKVLPNSINFMIEPDIFNIGCGIKNFKENGFQGTFINAFVSNKKFSDGQKKYISVDSIVKDFNINFFDIVHCDIQGFELDMLEGSIDTINRNKIGYFFISTHSNKLHTDCIEFLIKNNFEIIATANLNETFSEDGILIGRAKYFSGLDIIDISLNRVAVLD